MPFDFASQIKTFFIQICSKNAPFLRKEGAKQAALILMKHSQFYRAPHIKPSFGICQSKKQKIGV